MADLELLTTVALLEDLPTKDLRCGQVGTIVELLQPGVYEVEFVDEEGQTYAMAALHASQLIESKPTPTSAPVTQDQGVNENSVVRTVSPEKFRKANAKTSIEHAGLFRRLREIE